MKYLLFHTRNLKFVLILNTIYSTKLNCKRLWKIGPIITNNITTTARGSRLKHLLVIKTSEVEVFQFASIQRQFKDKMESRMQ